MKKYKYKPAVIETIQFDGGNFDEIADFIKPSRAFYIEYIGKKLNRIGVWDDGEIFWFREGCWASKQRNICYVHEANFENWLKENCEEVEDNV